MRALASPRAGAQALAQDSHGAVARELCGFLWDIACRVKGVRIQKTAERKDVIVLKRRPHPGKSGK